MRSPAAKCPEKARISRATEVSGTRPKDRMRRRRRRGSGAPRRLSRRTGKADRDSEEERPVPTTGPRRRAREPAPRRVPPAASVQADLRPESGDRARATEEAAARQPAKLCMDPCSCGLYRSQRWRHSRITIQDRKRTQAGPTSAQPPNAGTVSAFGRMPMRNRNRIVARLCARRPGGCGQSRTRRSGWKRHQVCAGAGERSAAQRALESSCYAPDHEHQENRRNVANQAFRTNFIKKGPVNCL